MQHPGLRPSNQLIGDGVVYGACPRRIQMDLKETLAVVLVDCSLKNFSRWIIYSEVFKYTSKQEKEIVAPQV